MADALASGASVRKDVGVQVPPRALTTDAVGNYVVIQKLDEICDLRSYRPIQSGPTG